MRLTHAWLLVVLGGLAMAQVGCCCRKDKAPAGGGGTPTATAMATEEAGQPTSVPLLGRWLRQDGGYVLEIRAATTNGTLDASYSNPRPIHVARAEWKAQDGALVVFVELQDVNYPGSTYSLSYDKQSDVLTGIYFQAVERANFDVEFVRMPAGDPGNPP